MRLPKPKNKKNIIYVVVAVLLIAGGVAFAYYKHLGVFTSKPPSSVNLQPATNEQQSAGQQIKQTNATANQKGASTGSDQPPAPTPQPSGKSSVPVSITAANQNGSLLQIRTLIEAVTSQGTCDLTLTMGTATVTKSVAVQPLASSSTCQGFDIPTNELSPGTWTATVILNNTTLTGQATTTVVIH